MVDRPICHAFSVLVAKVALMHHLIRQRFLHLPVILVLLSFGLHGLLDVVLRSCMMKLLAVLLALQMQMQDTFVNLSTRPFLPKTRTSTRFYCVTAAPTLSIRILSNTPQHKHSRRHSPHDSRR